MRRTPISLNPRRSGRPLKRVDRSMPLSAWSALLGRAGASGSSKGPAIRWSVARRCSVNLSGSWRMMTCFVDHLPLMSWPICGRCSKGPSNYRSCRLRRVSSVAQGRRRLPRVIGGGLGYAVAGEQGAKIGAMAGVAAPEVISRLMTTSGGRAMLKAAFDGRDIITPEVLAVLNQAARQGPEAYTSKRSGSTSP